MGTDAATLARDLAAALDPAEFARRAGVIPDDWQVSCLRSTARQQILLCCRQSGKSTVGAVIAVHTALYSPGSTVLLLSPSMRQSQELFRKALEVYTNAGQPVPAGIENRLTLELCNKSRIVSLPGKESTIRGFSKVNLLLVDEAGWVGDDLYQAVRPMLAVSQGRIVLLSTPNGKRGFFYHEWVEGGDSWHRMQITAHQVQRIDPDWLEEERLRVPWSVYASEYLCEFTDATSSVFRAEDIERAQREGVEQWAL